MKKTTALLFLTVWMVTAIFAQDPTDKKFHFGLKGTPGVFWLKPDDKTVTSNGMKFGFGYGLITEFRLAENYAFVTGIELSGIGGKFTQVLTTTTASVTATINDEENLKLQYIQIPFALKMKTKMIGSIKYFGQFGLGISINSKATTSHEIKITGLPDLVENDVDIKKNINPFRLALNVGGGIEYNLSGSTSLLIGAHYDNAFLNVLRSSTSVNPNKTKIFSKGIVITVGILF
jgi:hypothetical protein